MASESKGTVLVALGANATIAVAKFTGGIISGSSSLLAEGVHSVADTLNEIFLLRSLYTSDREADAQHPFGYGKERFFWSLLAAVGIFVAGAVFSMYEGVTAMTSKGGNEAFLVAYIILGISFAAEGTSWLKAVRQTRGEARAAGRGFIEHIRRSSDPTVKTVVSEDTAALIGILLAAGGIGLHQLTGNGFYDGLGAILIGFLLIGVAYVLANDNRDLLVGEAADRDLRLQLFRELEAYPEVDDVVDLFTMQIGPEKVLVAVALDLAEDLDSEQIEAFSSRVDEELRERHESVRYVFLDPTASRAEAADRALRLEKEMARLSDLDTGRAQLS